MAADDAPTGADDKKKSKEHTYLMIGLGVAGLVLGYITYRALTSGGSSSSTAAEVPVTTPVTPSTPTTSSAPTTSSTGSSSSSGSSSLTSTLLQDLLAQSQSAASTAAASQTAAQQLASQQLAAAQTQNQSLLTDVVTALKGSGGSSGVGSTSVPGASSGPNLVALASPAAAQTAAANHQALYWIPPNSSTPEQVPLGFTTQPGDRTLYTSP